jgi:SAM-dependent methyltransferase
MARVGPFEAHVERYEHWFVRHRAAYESELRAVRELVPRDGLGLEIGVGTARFAEPLGIAIGIDPSLAMLRLARERGVSVACAVAEALPFRAGVFDHVMIVTTICFVDDARAMLAEASRVLKPAGDLVIGFIDRTSHLGQQYFARRHESVFYRDAVFYSAEEVRGLLRETGFEEPTWRRTLTGPPAEVTGTEPPQRGFGTGGFVAARAVKRPRVGSVTPR